MELEHVLLGVPDLKISSKKASWSTNKIGGEADWICKGTPYPLCKRCDKALNLVIQIHCPLGGSLYHRTIYIFCCLDKHCWSKNDGWCVYRMQCVDEVEETVKARHSEFIQNTSKWADNADDWGDDDLDEVPNVESKACNSKSLDIANEIKSLRIHGNGSDLQQRSESTPQLSFPSYYINVFDENDMTSLKIEQDEHVQELIKKYEENKEEPSDTNGVHVCNEEYEKIKREDKAFYKFQKSIGIQPKQVIRYSWKGTPLYVKDDFETVDIPTCQSCGSLRSFEFQLMPALIPYLCDLETATEEVEFGTVHIYSCSQSCWKDEGWKEEHLVYFADPDLKYFKSQET